MYKILFFFCLHIICTSQVEKLQPIGSIATHVMFCPCRLFKYYENDEMFYFCNDEESNIEYIIREFKHKDGFDLILGSLDKVLFQNRDSILEFEKKKYLEDYLVNKKEGELKELLGQKAVVIHKKTEKTILFTDKDFIVSYEITVKGADPKLVTFFFEKSVNSLMSKRDNIKSIF